MSIYQLVTYIGIAAILLTYLRIYLKKETPSILVSFLQFFTGILFVISGLVKAVDPLGTAYKLEQYFAEFESTFSETWFSFLSPLFPALAEQGIALSTFFVVFEIVLGIALIIGYRRLLTAWLFLFLVVFFLFLTGFTYLTGYVPQGVNFFEFAKWGPYVETNMKVTDCGCFGDFIKLKPFTSFMKDVVLLIPALIFVFRHGDMHQVFTRRFRSALTWVSIFLLTLFSMANYMWDLPMVDFRPFFVGQDIREQRAAEIEAAQNVEVLAYKLTNKENGKVVEIPYEQFMQEYEKYPKEEWEYEQIKSEPAVAATKLTDFEVSDLQGNDVTEEILDEAGYSFMIVNYKMPVTEQRTKTVTYQDTLFNLDTILIDGMTDPQVVRSVDTVLTRAYERTEYAFDKDLENRFLSAVNPLAEGARADGHRFYAITAYAPADKVNSFRSATQSDYPFYTADDILLKTIIRSNPGIVLLKDGEVIQKWHWRQVPGYAEIKSEYLK